MIESVSQWARFSRPAAKRAYPSRPDVMSDAVGAQCRFIFEGMETKETVRLKLTLRQSDVEIESVRSVYILVTVSICEQN